MACFGPSVSSSRHPMLACKRVIMICPRLSRMHVLPTAHGPLARIICREYRYVKPESGESGRSVRRVSRKLHGWISWWALSRFETQYSAIQKNPA